MQPRKRKRSEAQEIVPPSKVLRTEGTLLLDNLLHEANELLDVVLGCPVGATKAEDSKEKTLCELKKEQEWLQRQLELYHVAACKGKIG
jgi:hypothetical protein